MHLGGMVIDRLLLQVWSDSAKAQTLHAAEVVGLGTKNNLRLISEPEAAAVYSLKAIQPNMLKVYTI